MTRVDALRTGELDQSELHSVQEHLNTCPSCEKSVADVEHLVGAVKAALIAAPPRSIRETLRTTDFYDRVEGVWVAFSDRAIRMISARSEDDLCAWYAKRYGRTLERTPIPDPLRKQVSAAVRGEGVEKPAVDLGGTSDLEKRVLETLMKVPRGEVRTYSWLAQQAGRPRAVRAVANVVARNIVPFVIPCHRIVPAAGGVGNYAYGSRMKRDLLRREGVDVDALDALAKEHVRFIGSRTTKVYCFPTCRGAQGIREENRVPFHAAEEAEEKGFRPCRRCQPAVA